MQTRVKTIQAIAKLFFASNSEEKTLVSGKEILASSLAMTYSSFCPQNQIDREKLEIVQILTISEPAKKLVILCRHKLFTPYQLFQKYQFPAKASLLE